MFSPLRDLRASVDAHPDRPALIALDGTWTFGELDTVVTAVAARLRELGIAPRQLVATDLSPADDWILTLALFRIATRTLSLTGVDTVSGVLPDALLTRPGRQRFEAPLVIPVDRLWIEQVVADAAEASPSEADAKPTATVLYPRSDSICRVIMTSGTTGAPRAVQLSVTAIEHRLANLHHYWTDARPELDIMSLSTTGGFHTALAALRHGVPYLAVEVSNPRSLRVAAAAGIQVLTGSPVQIGRTLVMMRDHGVTFPDLREVRTAGATASPGLLAEIADLLSVPVRGVYGSTEGGGVTTRMLHGGGDPANVGRAVPGLELSIVDEAGAPVPTGVSGDVRYRGAGLASGYLGDDTERSFRRGWFHPGDRGRLTPGGDLILEGRTAEIVNVGGVKIDPAIVDQAVEGFPGVIDAGAFVIEQRPGVPELGLAVAAEADCDLRALDQLLRRRLPGKHPTVFGQVSVIPRNRMGKVERDRLVAEFRRRLNLD